MRENRIIDGILLFLGLIFFALVLYMATIPARAAAATLTFTKVNDGTRYSVFSSEAVTLTSSTVMYLTGDFGPAACGTNVSVGGCYFWNENWNNGVGGPEGVSLGNLNDVGVINRPITIMGAYGEPNGWGGYNWLGTMTIPAGTSTWQMNAAAPQWYDSYFNYDALPGTFTVTYTPPAPPVPPPSVDLVIASSTMSDFAYWHGIYTNSSSSGYPYIEINYSRTSTTSPEYTDREGIPPNASGSVSIAKEAPLWSSGFSIPTTWNVWARMGTCIDYGGVTECNNEATSSVYIISISPFSSGSGGGSGGGGGGSWGDEPTGTSTLVVTCDPSSGSFWENSLCKAGIYLLNPSDASIERFNILVGTIKKKPPIGYISQFYEAFQNTTTNATSSIMDENTANAISGVTAPIKSIISLGIILLIGFGAYHKISSFYF